MVNELIATFLRKLDEILARLERIEQAIGTSRPERSLQHHLTSGLDYTASYSSPDFKRERSNPD
jgi:hypothetical protein